jgi:hypothetical protein
LENDTACLLAQQIGLAIAANREEGLRDQLAGMALQGCLAYSHYNEQWGDYHNNGTHADLAKRCYEIADAMLLARSAKAEGLS